MDEYLGYKGTPASQPGEDNSPLGTEWSMERRQLTGEKVTISHKQSQLSNSRVEEGIMK